MANVNHPFGFRPVARLNGGPFSTSEYGKPATDTNYAIFKYDLCIPAASSVASAAGNPAPGVASGRSGTPGTSPLLGSSLNYGAISTDTLHYVTDEPEVIYIAQLDDSTSTSVASHATKNANYLGAAGDATTKLSKFTINHTGIATTNTLDLHLIRISNIVPNAEGAYGIFECIINRHARSPQVAGV